MENVKLCPSCQFANTLANSACERCGAPLVALLPARITVPVPESLIKSLPSSEQSLPKPLPDTKDMMAIYLVGQEKPILIKGDVKRISFGRISPGETNPTVDLTPFDAHLFGVSRLHAIIHRTDNGCYLQDLGSTNGTWLKDKRLIANKLYAIDSGDMIRLGQLGFRPYFETAKSETLLTLLDEQTPGRHLTPEYLENHLTPQLRALAKLQSLLDLLHERPVTEVSIHAITVLESGRIMVTFAGARDALRLLSPALSNWRESRQIVIERLREADTDDKGAALRQDKRESPQATLRNDLLTELRQFTQEHIERLVQGLNDDRKQEYVKLLESPLELLLLSVLQPVSVEMKPVSAIQVQV